MTMIKKRWWLLVPFAVVAAVAYAHTDDTTVGRMELIHPDLGHEGGSALHTKVRNAWTLLSDNSNSRYEAFSAIADSTVSNVRHDLGIAFSLLTVEIYTGTHPNLTQVPDPSGSGWTIAAGSPAQEVVDVTTPGSGGPHTFSVVIVGGGIIPEASASVAQGTVSNAAQTFGGEKTFDDDSIMGSGSTITPPANVVLALDNGATTGLGIYGTTSPFIEFGDAGDANVGRINYTHSTNAMDFFTNASQAMLIASTGETELNVRDDLDCGIGTMCVGKFTCAALTNLTNLTSASCEGTLRAMRLGNMVTLSGVMRHDVITASTATSFEVDLPFSPAFSSQIDCAGTGTSEASVGTAFDPVQIVGVSANETCKFSWYPSTGTSNRFLRFVATYEIS